MYLVVENKAGKRIDLFVVKQFIPQKIAPAMQKNAL
jgi:hypothetical protein